jgi:hypothetical protein
MRLEGLGQLKNLVTSLGIESATFRLVPKTITRMLLKFDIWDLAANFRFLVYFVSGHGFDSSCLLQKPF